MGPMKRVYIEPLWKLHSSHQLLTASPSSGYALVYLKEGLRKTTG